METPEVIGPSKVETGLVLRPTTSVMVGEIPFNQLGVVGKVAAMKVLREQKVEATAIIQKLSDRLEASKGSRNKLLEVGELKKLMIARGKASETVGGKMDRIEEFLRKEGSKGLKVTIDGNLSNGKSKKPNCVAGQIKIEGNTRSYSSDPIVIEWKAKLSPALKKILAEIERDEKLLEKASCWLTDVRQKMADLPDLRDEAEAQLIMQTSAGTKTGEQLTAVEAGVRKSVLASVSGNKLTLKDI